MRLAVESYFALLKLLIALLLAGMVVLVFGNVVLRYAFNQGLTASEELSRLFFEANAIEGERSGQIHTVCEASHSSSRT